MALLTTMKEPFINFVTTAVESSNFVFSDVRARSCIADVMTRDEVGAVTRFRFWPRGLGHWSRRALS